MVRRQRRQGSRKFVASKVLSGWGFGTTVRLNSNPAFRGTSLNTMVPGPDRPPDPCAPRRRCRAAQISSGDLPRRPASEADFPTFFAAAAK